MSDELLFFRSCAPAKALWDKARDRPSSQLFMLNSGDGGMLSVAQSARVTATDFYSEFTSTGKKSRGIWGVSDEEIAPVPKVKDSKNRKIYLKWVEDEGEGKPTGHCLIDMTEWAGTNKLKKIAQALRDAACERGRLHPA